ncbi:MAG: hypothetical protein PHH08_03845, partial [Candidatus ainarchaeum sp.]|nr:hypothetical protein [Candidatus ainarchaeum sp.]
MAGTKRILLDGIKKLLALKVPDEEIIANLKDVGVGEKQARSLIEEVRRGGSFEEETETAEEWEKEPEEDRQEIAQEEEKEPVREEEPVSEEDAQAEALATQYGSAEQEEKMPEEHLALDDEEDEKQPAGKEAESISSDEKEAVEEKREETGPVFEEGPEGETKAGRDVGKALAKQKKRKHEKGGEDFGKLWEKGILTLVNQRLQEMKNIQADIGGEIQKRAAEVAKKEVDKVNALFEGQRALTAEAVNSKLEQKTRQLDKMLDAKVLELKEISRAIKGDVARLEKLQQAQKDGLKEIMQKLIEV